MMRAQYFPSTLRSRLSEENTVVSQHLKIVISLFICFLHSIADCLLAMQQCFDVDSFDEMAGSEIQAVLDGILETVAPIELPHVKKWPVRAHYFADSNHPV